MNNRLFPIVMMNRVFVLVLVVAAFPVLFAIGSETFTAPVSAMVAPPGVVVLSSAEDTYKIGRKLWIYEDPTAEYSFARIREYESEKFYRSLDAVPSFGFSDSAYWVKFRILDTAEYTDWVLELDYPQLDSIDLYMPRADGTYIHKRGGDLVPFGMRDVEHRNFVFDLETRPNAVETYYMRIRSQGSVIIGPTIREVDSFFSKALKEQILLGLYYGILAVMVAYNFFIFLSLRDKSYLYYILYISSYFLFQGSLNGLTYQYLWPSMPHWNNSAVTFFQCTTIWSSVVFSKTFLETKKYFPRLHISFRIVIIIAAAGTILTFILPYSINIRVFSLLALIGIIVIFIAAVRSIMRGFKPARFFLIAWIVFLVGLVISILNKGSGLIPSNFFTLYGYQIGSALEVMLLSMALADRINVIQKEKQRAQEKTLELNEKLRQYSRTLEQKVEERTHELREANEKLIAMDEMKTSFLSNVSHELRTPLTSILGFAGMIRLKLLETIFPKVNMDDTKTAKAVEKVERNIEIIVSESERLTSLINDVLDIAKMEAGKMNWRKEKVIVRLVLERAAFAVSALFESKGLGFALDVEPNLPDVVGDNDRLIQVVVNLLSNSIKFTDEGGVTVRAHRDGRFVRVEITDTGIGIAPEEQEKVFDKFKQAGDTLVDKPMGTGLGLPICRQIVEYHGGTIGVESVPGEGSTFYFTIPVPDEDALEMTKTVDRYELMERLRTYIAHAGRHMGEDEKKAVLVVDDDQNIRELLRQELEEKGFEVREAANGVTALNSVKRKRPDLIILDVMMPKMNGFAVAEELKHDPTTMDIPVLILSIIEDRERGRVIGVEGYFTKPIDKAALLRDVQRLTAGGSAKKRILVYDQSQAMTGTISDILLTQGYELTVAFNVEDFMKKAEAVRPDMVIIDADLYNEHNLGSRIRGNAHLSDLRVLLLGDSV